MRKRSLIGGAVLIGTGIAIARKERHVATRFVQAAHRRARRLEGHARGTLYRVRGQQPDPYVADDILADRIRSAIGPLHKRLDLPHVHVMCAGRVATLHGEVGTETDARLIEQAVDRVPGVVGVRSYLHAGLSAGDTRPSAGRALAHSPQFETLVAAARLGGAEASACERAVRGVLSTFQERLPAGEHEHLVTHLPKDVRALLTPPRTSGHAQRIRTIADFDTHVAEVTGFSAERAGRIAASVLPALRELVPEEARDVESVLPAQLKTLWTGSTDA